MWPTELDDLSQSHQDALTVQHSISAILGMARDLAVHGNMQQRTAVFALLIAGAAASRMEDKMMALNLLRMFEESALGRNTRATRMLLECIYRRKDEQKSRGLSEHVDWMLVAQEYGCQHIVHFGL